MQSAHCEHNLCNFISLPAFDASRIRTPASYGVHLRLLHEIANTEYHAGKGDWERNLECVGLPTPFLRVRKTTGPRSLKAKRWQAIAIPKQKQNFIDERPGGFHFFGKSIAITIAIYKRKVQTISFSQMLRATAARRLHITNPQKLEMHLLLMILAKASMLHYIGHVVAGKGCFL
ncbi:MAG: hypothetical protein ACLFUS_04340 [Candidatus Sumerlaeia bacterium]